MTGDDGPRTDMKMHLLFLDESGQLSERRFFALGGVALRDRDWRALRDLWQATLAEQSWPAGREVKWHGIRTGEVPPALAVPQRCTHAKIELRSGSADRRSRSGRPTARAIQLRDQRLFRAEAHITSSWLIVVIPGKSSGERARLMLAPCFPKSDAAIASR
ncbi:MAG: hypothetical protein ABIR67_11415, partial [Gaiellaceae bacterium]